jgi:hypothetical protein
MGHPSTRRRNSTIPCHLLYHLLYEFYPGPDTSLFFSSTYVELYRTSTCCRREFFRELVSGTPWWPAALAPTIAYGAAAPKPSAQVPSKHHGRRRLRLVWAQSTGGASGEYPPPQRNYVFFFNACTLLIISLNISIHLTLY